ncbi:Fes1-domain-containing protein [Neoconidiobolus thromboides FSU 785]|nr:Fes1-domain-containing protein [Neoconidiobolus thromboides FSU 785]
MEKLLQWGIKNSDPEELAKATSNEAVKDLDPEVIDAILGKSEATMMKENFQVIIDENVDLEQREVAFDNLEMLVEHIDNAKNLTPLKLWAPLIELLKNEHSVIRKYTAWTLGTATQNNPDAQEAFIQHNGFEALLQAMEKESEKEVLIKLIYALSCATRHHQKSLVKLQTLNGFQLIQNIVNRKGK